MLEQAVILAGGLGQRLGSLSANTPKPLQVVGGRPFLDHLVWNLRRFGIRRIVFSLGHHSEKVIEHFGDGSRHGIEPEYVVESEPLGTAGALRGCLRQLADTSLLLNGDTLFDFNYLDLALRRQESNVLAALALAAPPKDSSRFGAVKLDASGIVTGFAEKESVCGSAINGGAYVISRELVERIPEGRGSLERDVLPKLVQARRVAGAIYDGFFIDIGLPDSLARANQEVPSWRRKPAAFLDRDGVLNVDRGYVHRPEDFSFVEEAPEAVRWLNDRGILAIVITNQAGIARGFYDEHAFVEFSEWIQRRLRERGAHLDAVYYCPHHPSAGLGSYLRICECRKPAPGLFSEAIAEWDVDLSRSFAIGDAESDVQAAEAAGVCAVRFQGGSLLQCVKSLAERGR